MPELTESQKAFIHMSKHRKHLDYISTAVARLYSLPRSITINKLITWAHFDGSGDFHHVCIAVDSKGSLLQVVVNCVPATKYSLSIYAAAHDKLNLASDINFYHPTGEQFCKTREFALMLN